jgi:hypothetical protein
MPRNVLYDIFSNKVLGKFFGNDGLLSIEREAQEDRIPAK